MYTIADVTGLVDLEAVITDASVSGDEVLARSMHADVRIQRTLIDVGASVGHSGTVRTQLRVDRVGGRRAGRAGVTPSAPVGRTAARRLGRRGRRQVEAVAVAQRQVALGLLCVCQHSRTRRLRCRAAPNGTETQCNASGVKKIL